MNSWASDLSCTDSNYCRCCLQLTQVNRMSHEKKKKKSTAEGGTWSLRGTGLGSVWRVCVCVTEERGGQCLNVTAFLFAVNYGRGQGYWLCNSAEQIFSRSRWRWIKRFRVCVDVSLFAPIRNKASHSTADTESKKSVKTETKRQICFNTCSSHIFLFLNCKYN